MEAREKKQAIVVAALFGLLAVYWGYRLFFAHDNVPARTAAAPQASKMPTAEVKGKGEGKGKGPEVSLSTPIKVDLGLLKHEGVAYKAGRNIFNPVYKKPVLVKPKKGGPITVTPQPPLPPPPPPPRSAADIAVDNAKEDLNKVRVLGFLKRKNRTDVFLSFGSDSYIASKGDTITRGYYLKDIGKDYVIVADRDTNTEVRLSTDFESGKAGATAPMPGAGDSGPGGGPQTGIPPGLPDNRPQQRPGSRVFPGNRPYSPAQPGTSTGTIPSTNTGATPSTNNGNNPSTNTGNNPVVTGDVTGGTAPVQLGGHSI